MDQQLPTEQEQTAPQQSARDKYKEGFSKRHPDIDFEDKDARYAQMNADREEIDRDRGYMDQVTNALRDNPQAGQIFLQATRGEHPLSAMIEQIGIDGVNDILNDPDKAEEFSQANKKYLERVGKEKEFADQHQKNFEQSIQALQDCGLDEAQQDAAFDYLISMLDRAVTGQVTKEDWLMIANGINHDTDVEAARTQGEVSGRNQKIATGKKAAKKGDGLPTLGGANNAPASTPDTGSMLDQALMEDKASQWKKLS